MLKELYTAALGMQTQQTRLEVISNNMANASSSGFKRASVFERNLIDARANFYNVPGQAEQNDPPSGSYYDFSNGAYDETGSQLDVAIDGKGFFVLQDEAGANYLTRSGHFKLSTDGTIEAMDGKMLMGESGPIRVAKEILESDGTSSPSSLNMKIDEHGDVAVNGSHVGTLKIASIANPNSLEQISNQNFIATDQTEMNFLPQEQISLRQGWIENSNVNIINEMVSMIELQRMYEAGSKVIQTNDSTLDYSIKLGKYY
ncbi:MAG: flagellar hook-basal body protein [Candidatus Kapabacteria bacterium]|nr:flagellar hook-basal body protein [Candidatus Kapabacteria bacterium]